MVTVDDLKAQLIHAAYVGACAVCEPLISNPDGTQLKLDPLIQDVGLQQKGVLVYEEAKVQYHAMREVAVSTFAHVHRLSLRFHLERKTGGLSRVIERGTKGVDTLLSIAFFNTFPTVLELVITSTILM